MKKLQLSRRTANCLSSATAIFASLFTTLAAMPANIIPF